MKRRSLQPSSRPSHLFGFFHFDCLTTERPRPIDTHHHDDAPLAPPFRPEGGSHVPRCPPRTRPRRLCRDGRRNRGTSTLDKVSKSRAHDWSCTRRTTCCSPPMIAPAAVSPGLTFIFLPVSFCLITTVGRDARRPHRRLLRRYDMVHLAGECVSTDTRHTAQPQGGTDPNSLTRTVS
jgi:hypothetical protein